MISIPPNFLPRTQQANLDPQMQTLIARCITAKQAAEDALTESQIAKIIVEMLESGDFIKYVRYDNSAQGVVYIPFERAQEQEFEIERLKELLKKNGIDPNDPRWSQPYEETHPL